jgi:hypothetical protein
VLNAIRAIALSSALVAVSARADWTGFVQVTTSPGGSRETVGNNDRGQIFAKGARLRIDMDVEVSVVGRAYVIYDFVKHKRYSVIPELKKYVESDARDVSTDGQHEPPGGCLRGSNEECLQGQKFRKLRDEMLGERQCAVWTRERWTHSGRTVQTIWVLEAAKDVIPLKQVIKDRLTRTIVLQSYKEGALPESLFSIPDGYSRMTRTELLQLYGSSPPTRVKRGPHEE